MAFRSQASDLANRRALGPVFDTYGLKYTLIPGCVGLVISVFLFSICKGLSIPDTTSLKE